MSNSDERARARRVFDNAKLPEGVSVIVEDYANVLIAHDGSVYVQAVVVLPPAKGDGR